MNGEWVIGLGAALVTIVAGIVAVVDYLQKQRGKKAKDRKGVVPSAGVVESGTLVPSPDFIKKTRTEEFIRALKLQPKRVEFALGFDQALELFREMALSAETEFLLISSGKPIPRMYHEAIEEVVSRGNPFRFIVFEFGSNAKDIREYVDLGVEVRYYARGQFSLFIKDGKESFLNVGNPRDTQDRMTVCFIDEVISRCLTDYFEVIWQKAEPIKFDKNQDQLTTYS